MIATEQVVLELGNNCFAPSAGEHTVNLTACDVCENGIQKTRRAVAKSRKVWGGGANP